VIDEPLADAAGIRSAMEFYAAREWTDGLPVVPVTESYLSEFLATTSGLGRHRQGALPEAGDLAIHDGHRAAADRERPGSCPDRAEQPGQRLRLATAPARPGHPGHAGVPTIIETFGVRGDTPSSIARVQAPGE
jgi:hypothetical protein